MADDSEKDIDTGADDSQESKDTENEGADSNSDADDDGDGDAGDDEGEDDSKDDSDKSSEKDKDKDDDSEPEKRPKSVADFVAARRAKAAKKGDKDQKGDDGKDEKDDADDSDDDDSAPVTRKDLKAVMDPIVKERVEAQVDTDISSFTAAHPDFKPYAAKVRKWALHPNREGIPVRSIFYEVAGDDLMKIGAKRGKEADIKAKKDRTGGGSDDRDAGGSAEDVWKLTPAEFEKKQQEIRAKQ